MVGVRHYLTGLALALVVVTSSCGGESGDGGAYGDSAAVMPAGTLAYLDVNSDFDGDAWRAVKQLGSRFPGWQQMLDELRSGLESGHDSSWADEIEPLLGNDAGIAVTGISGEHPDLIGYVAVTDEGQTESEIAASDGVTTAGDHDGVTLYANPVDGGGFAAVSGGAALFGSSRDLVEQALDLQAGRGDALADQGDYQQARAAVPDDGVAFAFVDTEAVGRLAALAALADPSLTGAYGDLASTPWMALALSASDTGLSLDLAGAGSLGVESGDGATQAPADSLLMISSAGSAATPATLTELPKQLAELVAALSNPYLVTVRPGLPFSLAAVLHPDDPQQAALALRRLLGEADLGHQLPGLSLDVRAADDSVIVGNDPEAGRAPAEPLAASPRYQELLAASGAPDGAGVGIYVDIHGLLGLVGAAADPQLAPLDGLIAWEQPDGELTRARLFLAID